MVATRDCRGGCCCTVALIHTFLSCLALGLVHYEAFRMNPHKGGVRVVTFATSLELFSRRR